MEDLIADCDVTSDDFRRTFSFESCSDLLFDDRFEFPSHTSSSTALPECVGDSSTSSICPTTVSQPVASDSSSQIDIFAECSDVIDDSSFLPVEIDFDAQPTSFSTACTSANFENSQASSSFFEPVPTKGCESSSSSALTGFSVQAEPVKKSSEVCLRFNKTSHANYFSFLQNVMMHCKSISLEDYLEVNTSLINSSIFQQNNYWVRIAPEIVDFLYYTIDYLSGNCPNNFYHRSFRSPLLFEENNGFHFSTDQNNSAGQLIWGGRSTNDDTLLTWTDVWWSCRFMTYIPRIWRPALCEKIPQCHKFTQQEVKKRPRKQNKTEKYQKARKQMKANKNAELADLRTKLMTFDTSDAGFGFDSVEYSVIDSEILDSGTVSSIPFSSVSSKRYSDFAPLDLNPMLPCNDILPDTLSLISPNGLEESLEALTSAFAENKDLEISNPKLPLPLVDEHSSFHRQEQNRFSDPKKAFTYLLTNMTLSPVGPTLGATLELSNHISEYPTLEKNLLNHCAKNIENVYIIDLVRDASARLIGGKGSRVEIVNLFKQSQFVNLTFISQNENLVNGVVGICLEILQNCQTPYVELFVDFTGKSAWRYIPFSLPVTHSSKGHSLSISSNQFKSKAKSAISKSMNQFSNCVAANNYPSSSSCPVKPSNNVQIYPPRGRPRKTHPKEVVKKNSSQYSHVNNTQPPIRQAELSTSGTSISAGLLPRTNAEGLLTVKPKPSNKLVQYITISGNTLRCVPAKPTFQLLKTSQQSTGPIVPQVFYINSVS